MPITTAELLARQLDDARDWTRKLIADLSGDDWFFQPAAGLAHPLWLCGHLAGAQNTLIHSRCLGKSVLDEAFIAHTPDWWPRPLKRRALVSTDRIRPGHDGHDSRPYGGRGAGHER